MTSKKIIIGLTGVKQSGKNTAALMIEEHLPVKEVAFADKLKDTCAEVFEISRDVLDDQDKKEVLFVDGPRVLSKDKILKILKSFNLSGYGSIKSLYRNVLDMKLTSPRHIAQIVGTEVLRKFGENVHCENLPIPAGNVIVTDMRFPNEIKYLQELCDRKNYKFLPLYIKRDAVEVAAKNPEAHSSETAIFEFCDDCLLVENNGSLNELEANLKKRLDEVL